MHYVNPTNNSADLTVSTAPLPGFNYVNCVPLGGLRPHRARQKPTADLE